MALPAAATDLRALFEPRSVALIGASADPSSISARPLRLLRQHGYAGGLYPVNPKYDALLGLRVYPSISAVPETVDMALVIVPAHVVAGMGADKKRGGGEFRFTGPRRIGSVEYGVRIEERIVRDVIERIAAPPGDTEFR